MARKLGYRWRLREIMAARGMYMTTDLAPLLAERGIELSSVQIYRLVTQTPERLSLRTLMVLCDALECTSADLIEPVAEAASARQRRAVGGAVDRCGPCAPSGRRSSAAASADALGELSASPSAVLCLPPRGQRLRRLVRWAGLPDLLRASAQRPGPVPPLRPAPTPRPSRRE